jgi:hypothetical protein
MTREHHLSVRREVDGEIATVIYIRQGRIINEVVSRKEDAMFMKVIFDDGRVLITNVR